MAAIIEKSSIHCEIFVMGGCAEPPGRPPPGSHPLPKSQPSQQTLKSRTFLTIFAETAAAG